MSIKEVGNARFFFFVFLFLGILVAILSVALVDGNGTQLDSFYIQLKYHTSYSGLITEYALLWGLTFFGGFWAVHAISWRYRHASKDRHKESE